MPGSKDLNSWFVDAAAAVVVVVAVDVVAAVDDVAAVASHP